MDKSIDAREVLAKEFLKFYRRRHHPIQREELAIFEKFIDINSVQNTINLDINKKSYKEKILVQRMHSRNLKRLAFLLASRLYAKGIFSLRDNEDDVKEVYTILKKMGCDMYPCQME